MNDRSNGASRKKEDNTKRVHSLTTETSEVCLEQRFFDSAPPRQAGVGSAPPQPAGIGTAGMCLEQKFGDTFTSSRPRTDITRLQPPTIDTSGANPKRRLLDIEELEETYGFRRWTIRTYCSQQKIPFIKIGRRVFFDPAAIDSWIQKHARPVKEVHIP